MAEQHFRTSCCWGTIYRTRRFDMFDPVKASSIKCANNWYCWHTEFPVTAYKCCISCADKVKLQNAASSSPKLQMYTKRLAQSIKDPAAFAGHPILTVAVNKFQQIKGGTKVSRHRAWKFIKSSSSVTRRYPADVDFFSWRTKWPGKGTNHIVYWNCTT